jgi:hypothetical protein
MYLAGNDGVTRLLQLFAAMGTRSFYIRFRQNYPALRFFAPALPLAALQCVVS